MKKVKVNVAKTDIGYCANLDSIDGFDVAVSGSFVDLKREVIESIDFYIVSAPKKIRTNILMFLIERMNWNINLPLKVCCIFIKRSLAFQLWSILRVLINGS